MIKHTILWKRIVTDDLMLCRFVSKAGAGSRGGGDRQFCYVNGRPVDLPKVSGATHGCHTTFTTQQFTESVTLQLGDTISFQLKAAWRVPTTSPLLCRLRNYTLCYIVAVVSCLWCDVP